MNFEAMLREITTRWRYSVTIIATPVEGSTDTVVQISARKESDEYVEFTKEIKVENINNGLFLILRDIRQKEGVKPGGTQGIKG